MNQNLAQSLTRYNVVAKNAILYTDHQDYVGQHGIALRDEHGHVFFRRETTGVWTELFDADIPRLTLCGDCSLELVARIKDGDLVLKASRTMQRRAA